jgi:peptide/nickel transport system substrate-binding protein
MASDSMGSSGSANGTSRRDFLRGAAVGAGALGIGLAGCGGSSGTTTSPAATTSSAAKGTPKRGGTLRMGLTGGGSADTLDPNIVITYPSFAGLSMIYDTLILLDNNVQPYPGLATEVTSNKDATVWTIRLRKGVEFHNGRELTADDLAFTFVRATGSKNSSFYGPLTPVNLKEMKKLDKYTLRVPMKQPWSILEDALPANFTLPVLPVGFDPKHAIGTGPYKLKTFTPGQEIATVRNDNYWVTGQPYFDGVTVTEYADETSQVNAMVANQEDAISDFTAASIPSLQSGGAKVVTSKTGAWNVFCMRCDLAPFNDARVRQALRLIVDRPQMLALVFGTEGRVANDLFGIFDPVYDHSIPQREQDIQQAKSLLKQAGHENLHLTLVTADVAVGAVKQSEVFAQQAKAAGVTVSLHQMTSSQLYGPNFLKWPFSMDTWGYASYFVQSRLSYIAPPMLNESHWANPRYQQLFNEAMAITDPGKRTGIAHEMQMLEWNQSGYIIPHNITLFDAVSSRVLGVEPSLVGTSFNFYQQLKTMSFA